MSNLTDEQRQRHHLAMVRWWARRKAREERAGLPEPMPARNEAGERVYLHYRPLRWEKTP